MDCLGLFGTHHLGFSLFLRDGLFRFCLLFLFLVPYQFLLIHLLGHFYFGGFEP